MAWALYTDLDPFILPTIYKAIDKIPLEHLEPHANKETFDTLE